MLQVDSLDLTIYAIHSMQVTSYALNINNLCNNILLESGKILHNAISAQEYSSKTLEKIKAEITDVDQMKCLCTWKPLNCLNIFVYFNNESEMIVGIPMHSENNSSETQSVQIEYFRTIFKNETNIKNFIFFAHLTCDLDGDNNASMVLLVYDLYDPSSILTSLYNRYKILQSMTEALHTIKIGQCFMRVQWAGQISSCDKMRQMKLPHISDHCVVLHDDYSYDLYTNVNT